ncbi:P-type conjugative transfer protein TrbJ [Emcibacter nanhaiensis]
MMEKRKTRHVRNGAFMICLMTLLMADPARALFGLGDVVYDPANHAQNLLIASRSLITINNQLTGLQNQVRMLENMAKNLSPLEQASLPDLVQSLQRINLLISSAEGLSRNVDALERTFDRLYADQYSEKDGDLQRARERWGLSRSALEDSLKAQAVLMSSLEENREYRQQLSQSSESAEGLLQTSQAANRISLFQLQQLEKGQQASVLYFRARSLEEARKLVEKEEARALRKSFMGSASLSSSDRPW